MFTDWAELNNKLEMTFYWRSYSARITYAIQFYRNVVKLKLPAVFEIGKLAGLTSFTREKLCALVFSAIKGCKFYFAEIFSYYNTD
jgi:hypothetical protein